MSNFNQDNHSKSSLLDQALYYREKLGWSIIPVGKDKKPLIDWKEFQSRKATKEEIIKWWAIYPNANIGAVTGKPSGITAVDIDPRNGGSFAAFNRIETLITNTGGGGKHFICKYVPDMPSIDLKNGIEIKNDGRYIILPPSIHPNGKEYGWSMSPQAGTKLVELPQFVKDWVKNKQTLLNSKFSSDILKGVSEGQRNISAASLIGKLLILYHKEEWQSGALEYLKFWNTKNSPPLPEVELLRTFQSIVKRELSKSTSQNIYNNDLLTNKKLQVLSYREFINLDFPPNAWLVDKLIPKGGITCLSGQPKVGKSLVALHLAICIASEAKLFGYFGVEQTNVLYISKDEPEGLTQDRLKKMVNDPKTDISITFISDAKLYLDTDSFLNQLFLIIEEKQIKVIIIDSFRRIFKGNENDSQPINEVHYRLKKLQKKGVTIIFIHHHGKEGFFKRSGGDKLRGSSDILAMLDSLLLVEQVGGNEKIKITQAALRNDKQLQPFIIQLNSLHPQRLSFEFIDFIKEEEDKEEQAKKDILQLVNESEEELNQSKIIKCLLQSKEYGETTIKNAIKKLVEIKQISVLKKGKEKIYSAKSK